MPTLLNGKELATYIRTRLKDYVDEMDVKPCLAIVTVGDDPASQIYVRNKLKACEEIGITSQHIKLPRESSKYEVNSILNHLALDKTVHGIILQLPLPKHLDASRLQAAIPPVKDVDGFGKDSFFTPCTPEGIMELLEEYSLDVAEKHCVILGRSDIVGKPLAKLLLDYNATVSICHSYTPYATRVALLMEADYIFSCVGQRDIVNEFDVKRGAVLIDVGINRDENGKMCGDINPDAYSRSSAYTPVPGGIGPMTVAVLLRHVILAKDIQEGKENAENN
ncbi:MAG: bifunctional 5,10-methylenetetrahydrofolate dehydrogenase/5,10-methenyltetrahydrofolate cyclohydrolase [Lachnospiraceae bacterium]|nr:bifunctional 5,10-methylenetetrahydrofolate dehydrogenase/5,10-methenyltetrahydrofolate cyclohydrolase [Lachnospiraceae bacterium]